MKPGLYLFAVPSGSLSVLRIGWVRRIAADEYESLSTVTPLRNGDYKTMFSDAAIDGPPPKWNFTRPIPGSCPLNRFQIQGLPVPLQPKQWEKICPKPKDWAAE